MKDNTKQIVFLKSRRVVLRPIERSDLPTMLRWINDPYTNQYLASYLPMRIEDEEKWYKKTLSNSTNIVFAIIVDDKCIGNMGIHDINWKDRTATTGALIGEAEYRNNGYGSEAKMLLLNYAFNTLNLYKIKSTVLAFNERSSAYSKKCGYKVEGKLVREIFMNGSYIDLIQLAVFKEWWEPLWYKFVEENMESK